MEKVVVFIDMDGVLADWIEGIPRLRDKWEQDPPEMFEKGFFRNLPISPGAREAIDRLLKLEKLDIYIATKPTSQNLDCATEKYRWILEYFPELIRKMFLTCDKTKLLGDYLIDDSDKWSKGFRGTFIKFDEFHTKKSWTDVVEYFEETYS